MAWDNGFNDDTYAYSSDSCGPGCVLPPGCGDGIVELAFELCDEGDDNDDDAYQLVRHVNALIWPDPIAFIEYPNGRDGIQIQIAEDGFD